MTYAITIDCEWYMSKSIEVNTENIIKGLMHVKVNIVCWLKWCLYFVWLQNRPVRTKPFFFPDIFLASLTPLQDWFSPNIRGLFCETKKKPPKQSILFHQIGKNLAKHRYLLLKQNTFLSYFIVLWWEGKEINCKSAH